MKARTKITLWTSSFTLIVAICFSCFVFFELLEQPYRLIDRELRDIGETVSQMVSARDQTHSNQIEVLPQHPYKRYWISVKNEQGDTLFTSQLTNDVEIPLRKNRDFYIVNKDIPLRKIWIAQEDRDEIDELSGKGVAFRVMVNTSTIDGKEYKLLIAKPIPVLTNELNELIFDIFLGALLCTVIAVIISYYLAGRILRPLSSINIMVREISERSLDKRIPLGKNMDELHALSRSLNAMFDRLQHSFDLQKEFIGNASHELKSPLTILMLGHEEMLSEQSSQIVKDGLEKQLNTLRRLSKLVRNLLEISRLEQHETLNREVFDLAKLIYHVLDEFKEVLQIKNISVETDLIETSFTGDSEKILQMLINLVDNGIKYNLPDNGKMWVTLENIKNIIRFTITNTGLCISKDDLPNVFEQFYRAEKSRSSTFGGAGLGLTIVKHIVELHHGSISVTSNSEGITQFMLDFEQPQ